MLPTLNFAPAAIQDLQKLAENCMRTPGMAADAQGMLWVAEALRQAQKFMLPDGGRLIEDSRSIERVYTSMRLPFPTVALEYRIGDGGAPVQDFECSCPKRIALALEWPAFLDRWGTPFGQRELLERELGGPQQRRIAVLSLNFVEDLQTWAPQPFMSVLLTDRQPVPVKIDREDLEAGQAEVERHGQRALAALSPHRIAMQGRSTKLLSYESVLLPLMPRAAGAMIEELGSEGARRTALADNNDETVAVIALGAISSCANITSQTIPAPGALNRKRERNGKPPIPDYRILTLEVDRQRGRYVTTADGSGASTSPGGRARPGQHVRRGHIRRLESEDLWINAALVNPDLPPAAGHAYRLRERA